MADLTTIEAGGRSKDAKSLEQRVRSELLKLPYYGVFDRLAFQINGDQVTLTGEVSWPALNAATSFADFPGTQPLQGKLALSHVARNNLFLATSAMTVAAGCLILRSAEMA